MRQFVIRGGGGRRGLRRHLGIITEHIGRISIGQKGLSNNIRQGDEEKGRPLNLSSTEIALDDGQNKPKGYGGINHAGGDDYCSPARQNTRLCCA